MAEQKWYEVLGKTLEEIHNEWLIKKQEQGFVHPSEVFFDEMGNPTPEDAKWHYMIKPFNELTDEEKKFYD